MLGQAVGAATSMLVLPSIDSERTDIAAPVADAMPAQSSSSTIVRPALQRAADAIKAAFSSLGAGDATKPAADAVAASTEKVQDSMKPIMDGAERVVTRAKELAAAAEEHSMDVARVSTLFERAGAAVDAGDLRTAIHLLSGLRGYAGEAVRDWIDVAAQRVATDQAVSVARARAVVLTARLY